MKKRPARKTAARKTPAKRTVPTQKAAARKRTPRTKRPSRKVYTEPADIEKVYRVWLMAGGNMAKTHRQLRTVAGFECINHKTVRSICLEHDAEWQERRQHDLPVLRAKIADSFNREIASVAGDAGKLVGEMIQKVRDAIEDDTVNATALLQMLPKVIKQLNESLGEVGLRIKSPLVDGRQLHLHLGTPPAEAARAKSREQLEKELLGKMARFDIERIR